MNIDILTYGNLSRQAGQALGEQFLKNGNITTVTTATLEEEEEEEEGGGGEMEMMGTGTRAGAGNAKQLSPTGTGTILDFTLNEKNRYNEEILQLRSSHLLGDKVPLINYAPTNIKESNITLESYYQMGGQFDLLKLTRLNLLEHLLTEPFFDQLRTNQQVN